MPCGGIAVMYMKGGRPSGAPPFGESESAVNRS